MSFKSKENQKFYNPIRRAILNYDMIQPNEKIAVGMSGGKDSTFLFEMLDTIAKQERLGFSFEVVPISLDMGFDMDLRPMQEFVASKGYELDVVPTKIAEIVFDIKEEKNPCSLCAKLRRGILYKRSQELGCSKVALGHHLDDAVETYFMNFLFHGVMESFEPKTYLSNTDIHLIRPLIYLEEKEIIHFVEHYDLPVIFNPCPVDKKTKREEMKHFVEKMGQDYPLIKHRFIQAMEHPKENDWFTQFNPDL